MREPFGRRRDDGSPPRPGRKPFGADAPLWLNLLWMAAFALSVAIGVRVAQTGWRLGLLEILFVLVSLGALAGSLWAARSAPPRPRK